MKDTIWCVKIHDCYLKDHGQSLLNMDIHACLLWSPVWSQSIEHPGSRSSASMRGGDGGCHHVFCVSLDGVEVGGICSWRHHFTLVAASS